MLVPKELWDKKIVLETYLKKVQKCRNLMKFVQKFMEKWININYCSFKTFFLRNIVRFFKKLLKILSRNLKMTRKKSKSSFLIKFLTFSTKKKTNLKKIVSRLTGNALKAHPIQRQARQLAHLDLPLHQRVGVRVTMHAQQNESTRNLKENS